MATLNDRWVRIIGICGLWLLSVVTNKLHHQPLTYEKLVRILVSLASITITWHVIRYLIFYFRRRYFSRQHMLKRLLLTFLTGSLASTLVILITSAVRHVLLRGSLEGFHSTSASISINGVRFELSLYGFDLVQATTTFVFFQTIYEALFFAQNSVKYQRQLKEARREQEKLRTANLQSQLDALKQQVNPHRIGGPISLQQPQRARLAH